MMQNGNTMRAPSEKEPRWTTAKRRNILQDQFTMERRQCSVFSGSRGVIRFELSKPGETADGPHYRQRLAEVNTVVH